MNSSESAKAQVIIVARYKCEVVQVLQYSSCRINFFILQNLNWKSCAQGRRTVEGFSLVVVPQWDLTEGTELSRLEPGANRFVSTLERQLEREMALRYCTSTKHYPHWYIELAKFQLKQGTQLKSEITVGAESLQEPEETRSLLKAERNRTHSWSRKRQNI